MPKQRLAVLGSTGSIGCNTLSLVKEHPESFDVFALAANKNVEHLFEQCLQFEPVFAVMSDVQCADLLREKVLAVGLKTEVLGGDKSLEMVSAEPEVNTVVAAIVGAAGLSSTMAAAKAGKKILLANKESLVLGGSLLMDEVQRTGAELLPVDSEHNAIFQCIPDDYQTLEQAGIRRLLLTASGGPFLSCPIEALASVTPEQACDHPNWRMGQKISVDSATMMNKGLELIEACWLFKAKPSQIEVLIHPQSIVHSMVDYCDGSVLAQLGQPDMRTPIAHCLAWPSRLKTSVEPLDLTKLAGLTFTKPDFKRFPCLKLAIEAMEASGTYPAALNAANEIAVQAFLERKITYLHIAQILSETMENWLGDEPSSLIDVQNADQRARAMAEALIKALIVS